MRFAPPKQSSLINFATIAPPRPRSLVNCATFAPPRPRSPVNYAAIAPPRPRSRVNYATFAPPQPRSLVNYTKCTLPKLRTHPAKAAPKRHPLSRAETTSFSVLGHVFGRRFSARCLLNSALYPQPQVFESSATRNYFPRWPHATPSGSKRASDTKQEGYDIRRQRRFNNNFNISTCFADGQPSSHDVPRCLQVGAQTSQYSSDVSNSYGEGAGGRGRSPYGYIHGNPRRSAKQE